MLTIQNESGTILAYLNELEEGTVKEVLNGEYIISFVALINPLKTEFLYDKNNFVVNDDDLFRVVEFEELHSEDNMLTVSVQCEHISYDLIENQMPNFFYTNETAALVMTQCLLGTPFTLTQTDVTFKTDIRYEEECNSKQISIAIANNWKAELKYFRRDIQLLQQRGQNRGVDFRFGKNVKNIRRRVNFAEGTTSYEIEIVQGAELEELGYYELGDTVRGIDDALNCDVELRIIEVEKDIVTGINNRVILGDQIKDLRSSFSRASKLVEEVKGIIDANAPNWNKINDITNELGNVIIGKLNTITQVTSAIVNATGTFEQRDNGSYWQDQPTKALSTFATFWGAQGITFANSKDAQGEWIWQSALNAANGLIANKVTTSALTALSVEAVTALIQNLVAQTITGVTIEGSIIYAGNRLTGNYMKIDADGRITGYYNNKRTYSLYHASEGRIILGTDLDTFGTDLIEISPFAQTVKGGVTYTGPKISVGSGKSLILGGANVVVEGILR